VKLIALLSWFDEDPAHLSELAVSLRDAGVDHLVAVDGRYELYPEHQYMSSLDEYEALGAAWGGMGYALTLHQPSEPFAGNEIEKRNLLFALGHALAEPYEDWFWVIDGDELVAEEASLRQTLEETSMDVLTVLEYGDGHARNERRLFRAKPQRITLKNKHSHYECDGDVLWGRGEVFSQRSGVEVFHRPHERSAKRNAARNAYYEAVKEQGSELLF
jgi:hypothetical protein